MRILLTIILVFYVNLSFAGIKVIGLLEKKYQTMFGNALAAYDEPAMDDNGHFLWYQTEKDVIHHGAPSFPHPTYNVLQLSISNLEYDPSVPNEKRKINLAHVVVGTSGKLELVSYNKESGKFLYKLSLNTKLLTTMKNDVISQTDLQSYPVHFTDSKLDHIPIEGKVAYMQAKPKVITLYSRDNKKLSLILKKRWDIELKLLEDIPVSFEIDL